METKLKKKKSLAKRVKILFKQQKTTVGKYNEMANFNEPIAFLIRRNSKIEFFDNVTKGEFEFEHTDGKQKRIPLSPEYLKTFDYGKRTFKGYILDEDNSTPLPQKPILSVSNYELGITKTLNDLSKWKQKEYEGLGKMWINIAIAVAIVVGAFILAKMMGLDITSLNPFGGGSKEVAQTVAENITNTIG